MSENAPAGVVLPGKKKSNIEILSQEIGQQVFLQADVRFLRECLAWVHKHSPTFVQVKVDEAVQTFAKRIGPYCSHVEYVQAREGFACLDCGLRFKPNLKTKKETEKK